MKAQRTSNSNNSNGDGRLGRWLSFKRSDNSSNGTVAGLSLVATADSATHSANLVPCREQLHVVFPESSNSRRPSRRSSLRHRKNASLNPEVGRKGHHRLDISPESFPDILAQRKIAGQHNNSTAAALPDTHIPAFDKPLSDREAFRKTLDRLKSSNYGIRNAATSDSVDRHIAAVPRYLMDSDSDQDSSSYPADPVLATFAQTAPDVQVFQKPRASLKDEPRVVDFYAKEMPTQPRRSQSAEINQIPMNLLQRGVSEPIGYSEGRTYHEKANGLHPFTSVEHSPVSPLLPLEQFYDEEESYLRRPRYSDNRAGLDQQRSWTQQEATLSRLIATNQVMEDASDENESTQYYQSRTREKRTRRQAKPSGFSSLQVDLARISNHSRTQAHVVDDDYSSMQEHSLVAIEPSLYSGGRQGSSDSHENHANEIVRNDLYASTQEDEAAMIQMALERSVSDFLQAGQSPDRTHSGEEMRLSLNRFVETKNPIPCSAISVSSASAPYSLSSMSTDCSMHSGHYRPSNLQQLISLNEHAQYDNHWSGNANVSPVSDPDDMSAERFAELEQEKELIELAMERSLQDSQELSYREEDLTQDDFPVSFIDVNKSQRRSTYQPRDHVSQRRRSDHQAITTAFERHQRLTRVPIHNSDEEEKRNDWSGQRRGGTYERFETFNRQSDADCVLSSSGRVAERRLSLPNCNQETEAARMERLEREMLEKAVELSLKEMWKRKR